VSAIANASAQVSSTTRLLGCPCKTAAIISLGTKRSTTIVPSGTRIQIGDFLPPKSMATCAGLPRLRL
jgi:hypothetical protein